MKKFNKSISLSTCLPLTFGLFFASSAPRASQSGWPLRLSSLPLEGVAVPVVEATVEGPALEGEVAVRLASEAAVVVVFGRGAVVVVIAPGLRAAEVVPPA